MNRNLVAVGLAGLGTLTSVGVATIGGHDTKVEYKYIDRTVAYEAPKTTKAEPLKSRSLKPTSEQIVRLNGPIMGNAESVASEINRAALTQSAVYLLIDSPGGSVFDGAKIVAAIENSPVPVYTICTAMCASMAFMIHQYGTIRMVYPHSVLMAHPASGNVGGTLEQMRSQLNLVIHFVDTMNANAAARAGITLEEFKNRSVTEWWLDDEQALSSRLADERVYILGETPTSFTLGSDTKEKTREYLPNLNM